MSGTMMTCIPAREAERMPLRESSTAMVCSGSVPRA